jgi:uncharacterized protein
MSAAQKIIEAHYAASARGDLAAMIAPFDDAISWTEMAGFPYAGTYHGPAQIREQVFERLGGEWDDYQAVPDRYVDGGDGTVVAIGHYTGVYRATGRRLHVRFVHLWQLTGDKVVTFEQFTDTELVRRAMS